MLGRAAVLLGTLAILVSIAVGAGIAFDLGPWSEPDEITPSTPFVPARTETGVVIATADGTEIYLNDARSRMAGLSSMHGSVEETLGEDWPQALLQSLVDDVLILAEAKQRQIVVTEDEIADSVDRLRGMTGTEITFEEWLTEQGTTLPELERQIYRQILASRLYLSLTEDVSVSTEELRAYYVKHKDGFRTEDGLLQPFFMIREELSETLTKRRQDRVYAGWLDAARSDVELIVVEPGWWRELT